MMSIFSDYFSLSSTNLYINSKLFLRLCVLEALWCFNRVRGPLVTAPDLLLYVQYVLCFNTFLFCVQCIQQQSRLTSQLYMHSVSCALCLALACCVFIEQFLLLNSTCTWSRLWGWITLANTCTVHRAPCNVHLAMCTVHRAPTPHHPPCTLHRAPCNVHRGPCTVHRAPTGLSPITDNQGVSHGKYEPLLLSSNVLSSPRLMLDLLLKYQFVPIAPYKYWDRPTIDLNACRASTGKAHIQGAPKKSDEEKKIITQQGALATCDWASAMCLQKHSKSVLFWDTIRSGRGIKISRWTSDQYRQKNLYANGMIWAPIMCPASCVLWSHNFAFCQLRKNPSNLIEENS